MIKIEHQDVNGIFRAITANSNSYNAGVINSNLFPDYKKQEIAFKLAEQDIGSGHDNFLCGITVYADITAPLYWWKEFQRYHFVEIISSQSTMHSILQFKLEDQCVQEVDVEVINHLKKLREEYNRNPNEELWRRIIANTPSGLMLGATIITNYRQLKTIYSQRRKHRLKEWQDFCKWCESLPNWDDFFEDCDL